MDTNMKCIRCKFKQNLLWKHEKKTQLWYKIVSKIGVEQTKGHIIPYLYNGGDPIQEKTFQVNSKF
jgi:hypothetical protein